MSKGDLRQRRGRSVRPVAGPRLQSAVAEALETRRLFNGLLPDIAPNVPLEFPRVNYDFGTAQYTAAPSNTFDATAGLFAMDFSEAEGDFHFIVPLSDSSPNPVLQLHLKIDASGALVPDNSMGDNLTLEGAVDLNDNFQADADEPQGTLLTGKITEFGYDFVNSSQNSYTMNFRFKPTGGVLYTGTMNSPDYFANHDIGMVMLLNGQVAPSFTADFTRPIQGAVGPVPPVLSESNPDIHIIKYVNGADADTAPGMHAPAGSALTFTYDVTTTGNVPIKDVAVNDDVLGAITSFTGDANSNGLLDPGETWHYTKPAIAQVGQVTNTGTVTGKDSFTDAPVTDDNPANYFGDKPGIKIVKYVNSNDADDAPGVNVPAGSSLTFTYVVTNTGNVALAHVVVMDDKLGLITDYTGDTNSNGLLDVTETWTYTKAATAAIGQDTNIATVTASPDSLLPTPSVTDNNPANYFGTSADIHIIKYVNGNDADSAPGAHVGAGSMVTFTYDVTTTGNVPIKNVAVNDDVLGAITSFSGDANSNGLLDPSETWHYTKMAVAQAGQVTNTGTVTGQDNVAGTPVTANNPANYFGDNPAIKIVKYVNNNDADSAPGVYVAAGSTVTFKYVVTNTGNVPLANVALTDDKLGTITGYTGDTNSNGLLDLTETWTYTATAAAVAGQQTNIGTVTAKDTYVPSTVVTASNPANYCGYSPVKIGDFVWNDSNANGIQNTGEAGIAGVTLTLMGTDFLGNPVTDHTTTDGAGKYLFTEQAPGTYTVAVDASNFAGAGALVGYTATATLQGSDRSVDSNVSPSGTSPSALPGGSSDLTLDFGYYRKVGSISGTKYLDLTGNGLTCDDTPLCGVTIRLYKDVDGDGKLTSADGNVIATAVTAAGTGKYAFSNLLPGKYLVQEVTPTNYVRTGPTLCDTYAVTVTNGKDSGGNDFANFYKDCDLTKFTNISYIINGSQTYTDLRGHVHQGDQVQVKFTYIGSSTETVSLVSYRAPSSIWDPNVADQQTIFGAVTKDITAGTYTLTMTVPNCYFQIDFVCGPPIDHLGPNGSNILYGAQGRLFSADNGGTNACFTGGASISGTVFWDKGCNGRKDSNDTGIGSVVIKLTGKDYLGNTINWIRTTAADGSYSFDDLRAGTYTVTEVQPTGYTDGKDIVGTVNGTVDGKLAANDTICSIVLKLDNDAVGYDFAEIKS